MPARIALPAALLVLGLSSLLAVAPVRAGGSSPRIQPLAATAAGCAAWSTSYAAPPTIRVLRTATGQVDTVPFRRYVENVMSWEWPSSYPTAALQAGAVAVKQYAWYYVIHPRRSYVTAAGECYHVRDDSWDQVYDPSRTASASQVAAVDDTWSLTLRKNGTFFLSGYGPGDGDTCGAGVVSTRTRLAQHGVRACALDGLDLEAILRTYLDPGLTIADAVRRFGADRYETAAAVSTIEAGPDATTVFVATGRDFPDARAAGPAAAAGSTSVLLTDPDALPSATRDELARIGPDRIVVLGGPGAVSDAVITELEALAPEVERIAGDDRYATAVAVSAATFEPGVPVVFVATGRSFPDALAGAAVGSRIGAPVLLVPGDSIPGAVGDELTRLAPLSIRVLGGPLVVGDQVLADLAAFSPDVARLYGADRYETAAAVTAAFYKPGVGRLDLATGRDFPDALAAGPRGGPLLLLPGGTPSEAVAAEIARLDPGRLVPMGGVGALSDAAVTRVVALLAPAPAD
jgi:putative cell wall-binding protein